MLRLILVSFIWAFSFSLIGQFIVGKMDIYVAIFIRFAIGLIVLLPFVKPKEFDVRNSLKLIGIGALQIGLMYIFYFNSFRFLSVVEVALFTVVTPLYISLIGSWLQREFHGKQLLHVFLVVIGAMIIKWSSVSENFFSGFLLVQAANLSFGLGQVFYKRYVQVEQEKNVFALFYIGALIPITLLVVLYSKVELGTIALSQWGVLLWLGAIASGLGYYLWNSGAKQVSYGVLAVMNNLVIPLAILVNIIIWGKEVSYPSLIAGSLVLVLGVYLESRHSLKRQTS